MSKHDELKARQVSDGLWCSLTGDAIAAVGELETLVEKLREGVVQNREGDREYLLVCGCCSVSVREAVGLEGLEHADDCPMKVANDEE